MRIGIDARSLYYSLGGIGRTTGLLIDAMLPLAAEAEVDLVLFHSRKDDPTSRHPLGSSDGARWVPLWTPSHHRWEQWTLPVELIPHRLALFHSPDFIPPFHRRCAAVITVHDLAFLRLSGLLTAESERYYAQVHRAVRSAEAIVAVSEATRRDLVELLDVPAERVTVIHWGVERRFRPLASEAVRSFVTTRGLPERFLLWLGVIEPRKNLGVVLQALALLRDRGWMAPPLVVAGPNGWLATETLALVGSLRLGEQVRFLGRPDLTEQPLLYNAAEAFLFPSLYEGFGLPPVEAMACGTPVVASTTPALREVLGHSAIFVEPAEVDGWATAIRRIVEEEPLRDRLKEQGQAQAARYRWEAAARRYLDLYRLVVG